MKYIIIIKKYKDFKKDKSAFNLAKKKLQLTTLKMAKQSY